MLCSLNECSFAGFHLYFRLFVRFDDSIVRGASPRGAVGVVSVSKGRFHIHTRTQYGCGIFHIHTVHLEVHGTCLM